MRIDEEIRIYEADEFHFVAVASNAVRVFPFQESHVFEAQRKYSVASADHQDTGRKNMLLILASSINDVSQQRVLKYLIIMLTCLLRNCQAIAQIRAFSWSVVDVQIAYFLWICQQLLPCRIKYFQEKTKSFNIATYLTENHCSVDKYSNVQIVFARSRQSFSISIRCDFMRNGVFNCPDNCCFVCWKVCHTPQLSGEVKQRLIDVAEEKK